MNIAHFGPTNIKIYILTRENIESLLQLGENKFSLFKMYTCILHSPTKYTIKDIIEHFFFNIRYLLDCLRYSSHLPGILYQKSPFQNYTSFVMMKHIWH